MTALAWVAALALPAALGWALVRALDPACPRPLAAALGAALGPALTSLLHVGALAALGPRGPTVAAGAEAALLVGLLVLGRARAAPRAPRGPRATWLERGLGAFAAAAGAAMLLQVVVATLCSPHGGWDAWAIWNHRARTLARSGGDWALVLVGPPLPALHLDYPLAVPGAVARAWWFTGESTLAPALLALQAAAAGAAVVGLALAGARSRAAGLLGAGLVLAAPAWAREAATQCADVPLAALVAAAGALLVRAERDPRAGVLVLVGLAAGLAAWTKNEGLVALAGVVGGAALVAPAARGRAVGLALLGAAPALLALALHAAATPPNDLLLAQGASTGARLLEPARWALVARSLGGAALLLLWPAAALAAWLALVGLRPLPRPLAVRALAALLALQLAAYVLAYVTTPWELPWHLGTSRVRVLLHLWPSGVLLALLAARGPDD